MTLNTRPSCHAISRIAWLLGALVLSTVLVPITLATPSFSASPALTPTFSTPVSTATGFTVNVTNFNPAFTFIPKVSKGRVVAGVASGAALPLTVTGLNSKQSAKVAVTVTRIGYVTGHANVTGIAR